MAKTFTALEKNILKSKGLTDAQLKKLAKAGIHALTCAMAGELGPAELPPAREAFDRHSRMVGEPAAESASAD